MAYMENVGALVGPAGACLYQRSPRTRPPSPSTTPVPRANETGAVLFYADGGWSFGLPGVQGRRW